MDIFAHALWANAVYQGAFRVAKKRRFTKDTWIPVFFGVFPDLFSFGPFFVENILSGSFGSGDFRNSIPDYVHTFYNISHSLIIFSLAFFIVALVRRRVYWPMAAWALHIGIDVFSHSLQFFPTPILYPLSDFKIGGVSWGNPTFMAINYSLLAATYAYLILTRKKSAGYFDENGAKR